MAHVLLYLLKVPHQPIVVCTLLPPSADSSSGYVSTLTLVDQDLVAALQPVDGAYASVRFEDPRAESGDRMSRAYLEGYRHFVQTHCTSFPSFDSPEVLSGQPDLPDACLHMRIDFRGACHRLSSSIIARGNDLDGAVLASKLLEAIAAGYEEASCRQDATRTPDPA